MMSQCQVISWITFLKGHKSLRVHFDLYFSICSDQNRIEQNRTVHFDLKCDQNYLSNLFILLQPLPVEDLENNLSFQEGNIKHLFWFILQGRLLIPKRILDNFQTADSWGRINICIFGILSLSNIASIVSMCNVHVWKVIRLGIGCLPRRLKHQMIEDQ